MCITKVHLSCLLLFFISVSCDVRDLEPIGCFKYSAVKTNYLLQDVDAADPKCLNICAANHYKYVISEEM